MEQIENAFAAANLHVSPQAVVKKHKEGKVLEVVTNGVSSTGAFVQSN
jgi:hypothetical protein